MNKIKIKIQHWLITTVVYSLIFGLIIPTFWSVFVYPKAVQAGEIEFYITDHLGSPTMIVDETGEIIEKTDYQPYGKINYEDTQINNDYGFTGKELDEETDLQYYGQRYLDNDVGRFVSIDQVNLNLHDPEKIKELTGKSQEYILANPQLLNSYSYTANNPVNALDPDGNFIDTLADIGFIGYDVYKITQSYIQTGQVDQEYVKSLSLDSVGALIPGATGLGIAGRVITHADEVVDVAKLVGKNDSLIKSAFTPLKGMDIVKGAQSKLEKISSVTGKTIDNILGRASKSDLRFIDNAHTGNINIFLPNIDRGNDLIRITLDPSKNRIISSGFNKLSNVINNISKGRFKLFD